MTKKTLEYLLKKHNDGLIKGVDIRGNEKYQRIANINYLIGYADGKGWKLSDK